MLGDLDEAWGRDVGRGLTRFRASRRYLRNTLASAWSLARPPRIGVSLLDLKLGLRMLRRQPALTGVAVFALSAGIPVGMIPIHLAQVFSAELPFDEGDRILRIQTVDLERSRAMERQLRDYRLWREELESFVELGAASAETRNIGAEEGRASPVRGSAMTASLFELLRVAPHLGRPLHEADEVPGAPDVVVISHDLWTSRLAGAPDVIGRRILVGSVRHEVVGVMPEGFLFPHRDHFWIPFRADPLRHDWGSGPWVGVYGRLAEGVTIAQANVELNAISLRLATEQPVTHGSLSARASLVAGSDVLASPMFWVLQSLALLLLVIACGNVGILILARTATRRGEIAVRTALGANRARIVGQLFTEALVLAVLGAGFGLMTGDFVATRIEAALGPQDMPFWLDLGVTWHTALTALGLATLSAGVAGVLPALKATSRGVQGSLQRASAGVSGIRFGGLATLLIVAEVALATTFLAIGGQIIPSVLQDPEDGMAIAPDEYLTATLQLPFGASGSAVVEEDTTAYRTRVRTAQGELLRRLSDESGVRGVALGSRLPGEDHTSTVVEVEGADEGSFEVRIASVHIDFFRALGQAPVWGRGFNRADVVALQGDGRTAVVVNESFVEDALRGRDPVGQRVRLWVPEDEEPRPWLEIVGVVGHLGMNEMNPDRDAGLYLPVALGELNPVRLAVHLGTDPVSFIPELRRITASVDADAIIEDPMTVPDLVRASDVRVGWFWSGVLATVIAAVAVVLSAAGLFALVSFTVSERRREIGIRTALGAQVQSIVTAIGRRAFVQLTIGVIAGLLLRGVLDLELSLADDPAIHEIGQVTLLAVASLATIGTGLIACLPPLLRALRIRPIEVLKEV